MMMTDEEQHDLKAQLRAAEERIANLEDRDALLRDAVMWFNFHRPVWKTGDNKFPLWFIEAKTQRQAMLAKAASRTSASYQYEIGVLREALRDGLAILNNVSMAVKFADDKAAFNALSAWIDQARAALDRTDWRAE